MKQVAVLFLLGICLTFATAQNRLYVYVEYDPSMQILGYGGSGFYYDHILLLPDGTAFRFDDVSDDSEQVLPGGINLATATATDLANAGGTQGTYQDDGTTVTTSFGVSFASAGEKFDYEDAANGYMLVPPLQPSFITGEYNNFSATVIGGGFTNTPLVTAGESNNYFFYADGKFGFEESSGVSADAGNVGVTSSSEGSAAGSYLFEGYNLFLTYNDGSQAVLPAYLWPPYSNFADQILMVGNDEFLDEDESNVPSEIVPATGAASTQPSSSEQNPLSNNQEQSGNQAQNPLAIPTENPTTQNPLSAPSETNEQNPLAQPSEPVTPQTSTGTTVSGTVTLPEGFTAEMVFVSVCLFDMADSSDCITGKLEPDSSYNLQLPDAPGEYLVMAAVDADGNGQLNTGDYVGYDSFDTNAGEARTIDLSLEPYSE